MRHLHSQSHFRHALFALQDADGYVEALLDMARDHTSARRAAITFRPAPAPQERRTPAPQNRTALN
jgi:hypothetical protein